MKKLIASVLTVCIMLTLVACASGKTDTLSTNDGASVQNQSGKDPSGTYQTEGGETGDNKSEEPAALTFANFSSGIVYENGSYLFQIDSMEMTDEGYVITYRAATDTQGNSSYYNMKITVNGITFPDDAFQFSGNGMIGYSMIGGGRDEQCQVMLSKELLDLAGIQEVLSLQFDTALGHESTSTHTYYEDVTFTASVYPGEKTDTSDWFPESKNSGWILYESEEGKLQITGARYWRSAFDGSIMGINFSILEQGAAEKGTLSIRLDGLDIGAWTANDCQDTSNYIWLEGKMFRQCTIYCVKENAPEGLDFSQAILRFTLEDHQTGTQQEFSVPLDLSGLGDR